MGYRCQLQELSFELARGILSLPTGNDAPFVKVFSPTEAVNQKKSFDITNPAIVGSGDDFIGIRFTAGESSSIGLSTATRTGHTNISLIMAYYHLWASGETCPNLTTRFSHTATGPPARALCRSGPNILSWNYITQYDWCDLINLVKFWGVYGDSIGCSYIHPSKECINGDHQEGVMVHRESNTGDTVLLNMIHGLHVLTDEHELSKGRIWGPWLQYLNDGSVGDAYAKYDKEVELWPYSFPSSDIEPGYHQRISSVQGVIMSSDGASVLLGDNQSNQLSAEHGANYYYHIISDGDRSFVFENVLQCPDLAAAVKLGEYAWDTQNRAKYYHGLSDDSPADLEYDVSSSDTAEWFHVQAAEGTWQAKFGLFDAPKSDAVAVSSTSLAGYSSGVNIRIITQGGNITIGELSGPHQWSFELPAGVFVKGSNTIEFTVTQASWWYGFMWDSVPNKSMERTCIARFVDGAILHCFTY
ncbi:putative rhamnogalacturonase [Aspergillus alliaceus]|uniref:putative rhamnogalacturonase n=1 Tax=Petromyces alliaceus TaxID=209559 RepID=UPI0012A4B657|nr:uncharacterized protein BDW43DRAFT_301603 [Aspergillus alliaceus]KAB8231672.1 hypothetical protein BDW43DRAFT_301603 [Aspergillus alliaceus]